MELKQYKVTITVPATLVYYVSEHDVDNALELAMDAPYKEWQVSDFQTPMKDDIDISVGMSY